MRYAYRALRSYGIEGATFVYTDHDTGRITTVLGYPTDLVAKEE